MPFTLKPSADTCLWPRLISLHIPLDLFSAWKLYDSGPGMDLILMLTNDDNLYLICQSERLGGDWTFKAAPKQWTQRYTDQSSWTNEWICSLRLRAIAWQTQRYVYWFIPDNQIMAIGFSLIMGIREGYIPGGGGLTLTGMDTMMAGWWVGVGNSHLVQMH